MQYFKSLLTIACVTLSLAAFSVSAEEKKAEKLPDGVSNPNSPLDAAPMKRAKLTEEQAVKQLKFMTVFGWARIEKDLVEKGKFNPMGMVLYPDGVTKPLYVDEQDVMDPSLQLAMIAKSLKEIAQTRTVWAVGIIFSQIRKNKDGSDLNLIIVNTEHIAGWGRHWAYPYFVEKGELLLGQSTETPTEPFYFIQKK